MPSTSITIRRGMTKPDIVWRIRGRTRPFNGTGSVFELKITCGNDILVKLSDDPSSGFTYDNAKRLFRWVRSVQESLLFHPRRSEKYEIARLDGAERSLMVSGSALCVEGIPNEQVL